MKPVALLAMLAGLGLAGCGQYRPSQANCFSLVSRNATSMAFLPEPEATPNVQVSTMGSHGDCTFIPLGGGING